jgi:predicted SAM-dependent methyltransferase
MKLELGCGGSPTAGYVHHDRKAHAPHVDVVHDLDALPWPFGDESCEEILALDVFEHLHLMPEHWMRECHRILVPGGILHLRVPIFGSPWHLIDPTHVRGFHPQNFDYFVRGRHYWNQYGHFYFDFSFENADVSINQHNIIAILTK